MAHIEKDFGFVSGEILNFIVSIKGLQQLFDRNRTLNNVETYIFE